MSKLLADSFGRAVDATIAVGFFALDYALLHSVAHVPSVPAAGAAVVASLAGLLHR